MIDIKHGKIVETPARSTENSILSTELIASASAYRLGLARRNQQGYTEIPCILGKLYGTYSVCKWFNYEIGRFPRTTSPSQSASEWKIRAQRRTKEEFKKRVIIMGAFDTPTKSTDKTAIPVLAELLRPLDNVLPSLLGSNSQFSARPKPPECVHLDAKQIPYILFPPIGGYDDCTKAPTEQSKEQAMKNLGL